ncbi:phosphatidylserine decarboxylase family protein [Desulfohalobium retbaense]|uniref:Phosphatidylserine decarboxylase proenzyme n=1 Tax=Desulfohalobium retbaense (strain ATCC 49708 / DSM 5692 / JCM 16813 / HR100) TaxID=485915 RepID=C8X2V1_DESRD|nr:phosphatidylserine decarboxylase family protein [Desulfohalobium retbaense]ACV68748.1 phosphatidylserine decarboxylase related protein [Desulfohalobium retbaense DSM 5692]
MQKPSCGVSLEGLPFLGFTALTTLVLAILGWWHVSLVALIATFFILHFFRDPERVVPDDPGVAVSPADGKIIAVDFHPDPITGQRRQRICVFMNVFNVHVNRMPVAGTIQKIVYYPGKFFNASLDKASADNERNVVQIRDAEGLDWTCVQIAGLVARRIICWAETGDGLARGQRMGLIKFGSRVDLYLPEGYESSLRTGDIVHAGQSVLARKT